MMQGLNSTQRSISSLCEDEHDECDLLVALGLTYACEGRVKWTVRLNRSMIGSWQSNASSTYLERRGWTRPYLWCLSVGKWVRRKSIFPSHGLILLIIIATAQTLGFKY